ARRNSMKRGLRVPWLALLALTTLGTTAATEEKFQKLTAGQIRAKLAGMELTDNVHWRDLYQRNGTVMSTSMGRKRTGKWRVEQIMVGGLVSGATLLDTTGAGVMAQDVPGGEAAFRKCQPCHDVGETAKNKLGPELNGLDGRKAGTAEGYAYSDSNKNSGIVW